MVRLVARQGIRDKRVLEALATVPRHLFVPEELRDRAYDDCALPIGYDQTISHPSVVARCLELLELKGNEKVLEVGTGSGYQAALLAHLARMVLTVERIPQLAVEAAKRLRSLGIANVVVKAMDGSAGWAAEAPFDAVVVAAAAPRVPRPLIRQLAESGRMVIPLVVGNTQRLALVSGAEPEHPVFVEEASFVPLVGRFGC